MSKEKRNMKKDRKIKISVLYCLISLQFSNFCKAIFFILLSSVYCLVSTQTALAVSSTNYGIPQYQLPDFGERSTSEHYILDATGGPIVGVASSTNYGLDTGFPSVTGGTIALSLDSNTVELGNVTPGTPITGETTATVATDSSAGYQIAISKNKLLTHSDTTTTISDYSGTIETPTTWSGNGFGFTVSVGTNLEAKWDSGAKFASVPTSTPTTAHGVVQSISSPDETTFNYKLNVANSQKTGNYSNTVSYLATVMP